MKSGFTLIEILVASLLSALLGAVLIGVMYQLGLLSPLLDRYVDAYGTAMVVNKQLERDLSGAYVPQAYLAALAKKKKEKKEEANKESNAKEADAKKKAESEKKDTVQAPEESDKKSKIKRIFMGSNKDGMLEMLTFITTNPLQSYWKKDKGTYIPRFVRVVYRLQEDKRIAGKKQKSYVLTRQESDNLDLDAFGVGDKATIKAYTVAEGIKSLKVTYAAFAQEKKKEEAPPAQAKDQNTKPDPKKDEKEKEAKPPKPPKFVSRPDWKDMRAVRNKDSKEVNKEEQLPFIPQAVSVQLELYDLLQKKSTRFTLAIRVPADPVYPPKEEEKPSALSGMIKKMSDTVLPQLKGATP